MVSSGWVWQYEVRKQCFWSFVVRDTGLHVPRQAGIMIGAREIEDDIREIAITAQY